MGTSVILQQMGVIVILVSIGIYLYKKGVVDSNTSPKLSTIVVDICNPALILASILSGNITATHKDLLIGMVIGVIFYAFLIVLGLILPRILRVKPDDRRYYNMMTVYTNTGFIGIPIARAILPENAILYVIIVNVMYSLLFYTHGITVLSAGKEKMNLKRVFSPGTIMAVLALVVFWFNLTPPPIISNSISYIGNPTVFLSMTILGVSIARSNLIGGLKNVRIWGYVLIRMILVPVMVALVLRTFNVNRDAILGVTLMAAVPIGNLPMITAEKMGLDTELLSTAIAVTTAVSIITITALMSVFSAIL
jgi:Predicted permeases